MPRYLGIDYGTKRIGLAVGDSEGRLVTPLRMVQPGPALEAQVRAVLAAAAEYEIDGFVVGLPLNMDDTEGPQAKLTRAFGDALAGAAHLPVHYYDERLSSCAAEELLLDAELTRKKKRGRIDSVAAQVMLQGFLESAEGEPNA